MKTNVYEALALFFLDWAKNFLGPFICVRVVCVCVYYNFERPFFCFVGWLVGWLVLRHINTYRVISYQGQFINYGLQIYII